MLGVVLFVSYFCLLFVLMCLTWMMETRVRELDPELADRLGHSISFAPTVIRNQMRWNAFLFFLRFRQLGDPRLNRLCYIHLILGGILLATFVGLFTLPLGPSE